MGKILVTHEIHRSTVEQLGLQRGEGAIERLIAQAKIDHPVWHRPALAIDAEAVCSDEILYVPGIAAQQIPDEAHDPTLGCQRRLLQAFQPDVLVVGNNAVPAGALRAWREAVGPSRPLRVIRRGVDTRAIDKPAAADCAIAVGNLPGINSPFVARHMLRHLKLDQARPGAKIAVVGVGNINAVVAQQAIAQGLAVHLVSPSLSNPKLRPSALARRGLDPSRVVCASLGQAFESAQFGAIAVPWEHPAGGLNAGLVTAEAVGQLAPGARIASASPPKIFSPDALALLQQRVTAGALALRIDTAKRLAEVVKRQYPALEIAYNEAFADPACQQALDRAWLQQAKAFIHPMSARLLSRPVPSSASVLLSCPPP